jgi:hypothetical protein
MAEDRRAFIVHFPAIGGKTQFARRVCQLRADTYYLDLQANFLENHQLPPIADCDPTLLKKLLLGLKVPAPVVLVDNPDFLFNTWDTGQKSEFLNMVNRALRSPSITPKTFVFFFQDDSAILSARFEPNIHGEARILPLDFFDAL